MIDVLELPCFNNVLGLVEAHVSNMSEYWDVLKTDSNARVIGSTNANEHSSRFHWSVCQIETFN